MIYKQISLLIGECFYVIVFSSWVFKAEFLKQNLNLAFVRASYGQIPCAESCLVQINALPRVKLLCYRIFMHRILFMRNSQIY